MNVFSKTHFGMRRLRTFRELKFHLLSSDPKFFISVRHGVVQFGSHSESTAYSFLESIDIEDKIADYFAFGGHKNSEFTEIFNFYITQLKETGILKQITDSWIDLTYPPPPVLADAYDLGYSDLIFPYLILVGGVFVGVFLLMSEFMKRKVHNCHSRNT